MADQKVFAGRELQGALLDGCDLTGLRAKDCWLVDVELSGEVERLVVNDVDVTAFVDEELDRRMPARRLGRLASSPDEHRAAWAAMEEGWAGAVGRARSLPEPERQERVGGEWSFVETLRHLVFAIDAWAQRTILDLERPFHPLGLTHTPYPRELAVQIGIDVETEPSFEDALAAAESRFAVVRSIVEGLTDTELARNVTRAPAPGYPEFEEHTVAGCLKVVYVEVCEHLRYATRDLAALEARR